MHLSQKKVSQCNNDDDDDGDNDTYYFNPGFRMEFISEIINENINTTWLINNESNTTQALIADGYAILYNDTSLLITDPDDDYSYGHYTIESYLVIYSSQSICDAFEESEAGNRYFINNNNRNANALKVN